MHFSLMYCKLKDFIFKEKILMGFSYRLHPVFPSSLTFPFPSFVRFTPQDKKKCKIFIKTIQFSALHDFHSIYFFLSFFSLRIYFSALLPFCSPPLTISGYLFTLLLDLFKFFLLFIRTPFEKRKLRNILFKKE